MKKQHSRFREGKEGFRFYLTTPQEKGLIAFIKHKTGVYDNKTLVLSAFNRIAQDILNFEAQQKETNNEATTQGQPTTDCQNSGIESSSSPGTTTEKSDDPGNGTK